MDYEALERIGRLRQTGILTEEEYQREKQRILSGPGLLHHGTTAAAAPADGGAWDTMIMPLKRYAEFDGRSRRQEYWLFTLLQAGVYILVFALMAMSIAMSDGRGGALPAIFVLLFVLLYLALIIPNIAVTIRRLHDQDRTGWLYLLNFIPYIGWIIVMVLMCLDGTRGPNQFGPDPKGRRHFEAVFG